MYITKIIGTDHTVDQSDTLRKAMDNVRLLEANDRRVRFQVLHVPKADEPESLYQTAPRLSVVA